MKRGSIYFVSLEPTVGHEQQGHRPVLVVSPDSFNRRTNTPIIVPITNGGSFARNIGLAIPLHGRGLRTTGLIRCDQPRSIDLEARGGSWVESVPDDLLEQVLDRISSLFNIWQA